MWPLKASEHHGALDQAAEHHGALDQAAHMRNGNEFWEWLASQILFDVRDMHHGLACLHGNRRICRI